jgi:hypothetical protein
MYLIDPDGPGIGNPPFTAECDMTGTTGKLLTSLFEVLPEIHWLPKCIKVMTLAPQKR